MLDKERIGRTIAFYRKRYGMTQKDLADKLHISYQAVSKWEAGTNLPTVELIYEVAELLGVTVDMLLNADMVDNRQITYMDTGLNTQRLYELESRIMDLTSEDASIVSAHYADALMFSVDTSGMEDPVFAFVNCIPGSKEGYARVHGYDEEIVADSAANAINHILQHGFRPVIMQGQIIGDGSNTEQLYRMAQTIRRICDENDCLFGGMEVAAQPVNYRADEYKVATCLIGVQERGRLLKAEDVREGDVLIGIDTEGINGTNYPIIKVMLERKPELAYTKTDKDHFLVEEMMKPNLAYAWEIRRLQEAGCIHAAFRISNHLINEKTYTGIPYELGMCIDLSKVPVPPLYRTLIEQDMIGPNLLQYHFHFGIGMIVAVPEAQCEEAMKIIRQFKECRVIGSVERNAGHGGEKVWIKGKLNL